MVIRNLLAGHRQHFSVFRVHHDDEGPIKSFVLGLAFADLKFFSMIFSTDFCRSISMDKTRSLPACPFEITLLPVTFPDESVKFCTFSFDPAAGFHIDILNSFFRPCHSGCSRVTNSDPADWKEDLRSHWIHCRAMSDQAFIRIRPFPVRRHVNSRQFI